MPDSARSANRPVTWNATGAFESRSRNRSTSPTVTCSSAAAAAGSAAGIGVRAAAGPCSAAGPGAAGHWPVTSTAYCLTLASAAASSSGVLPRPALAGRAGDAPGTKPSGLDHDACQKPNGTPGSAVPIALLSAAVTGPYWVLLIAPVAASDVPGATVRSCLTACGSAWPAKAASAAPTAAATSVVSAAAARTTQCAVMRRAGSGPRGPITNHRISYLSKHRQFRSVTNCGPWSRFEPHADDPRYRRRGPDRDNAAVPASAAGPDAAVARRGPGGSRARASRGSGDGVRSPTWPR